MTLISAQLAVAHESNNTNEITSDDAGITTVGDIVFESSALVQFVVLATAILAVTGEYGTGSIRGSLQAVPVRGRLLLAKAAVLAPVMFVAGTALALLGGLTAEPLLGEWGSTEGFPLDILQAGIYLAAAAVLVVGLAAALRSTAGALTAAFLLLTVLPVVIGNSTLGSALPSMAGLHFMQDDTEPYGPAAALLILAAWTAALFLAGREVMRRRDA
ncbi:hypothetical protein GCM10010468_41530 [Actinocorallia longicatena]|uniref:ABC-2 type transport system permease protein n=1 Tax=Actinocorallia longicatena TaxID=111803 RepID=A0ABP6QBV8_9ACTN